MEIKLLSNGADGKFGGTSNATRDLLVIGAYEAKGQYVAQVEQKKKEEEEKKKKEEEEKKKAESTPPPVYSQPYVPPTVATPSASPAGGAVSAGTSVALSTSTSGAEIHYTLDGSTPTASSPIYNGSIIITSAVTIKAIAIKSGETNSAVMSESYTVTPPIFTPGSPGTKSVDVEVMTSVTGTVYSVVTAVYAPPPSLENIMDGYEAHALDAQAFQASAGTLTHLYINGLPEDDTFYTLYLIVTDGTVLSGPFVITIKTPPAAEVDPSDALMAIIAYCANWMPESDPIDLATFTAAGITGVGEDNLTDVLGTLVSEFNSMYPWTDISQIQSIINAMDDIIE
ncbi:MAG: chitobiase/beta-hexosaminidase C-terminal domain-containing protein [Cohnella sp.]|nr:chitobiase/beta-hexosaminidase C-terminal domain-containing protein [Cohnella sp.]